MRDFKDLIAWQLARKLVKNIYIETKNFPKEETFALTSQIRRSVISIPSNIAEGHSRHGTKDYINFLSIALGSLLELETQIILASDLGYISNLRFGVLNSQIIELKKSPIRPKKIPKNPIAYSLLPNPNALTV